MTVGFGRPVGAHADCKELEYIAALHQSGRLIRHDGSINSDDVVAFLASRHGIIADKQYVEETLMPGLAGAMDDTPEAPVFDIVELASILLIPHLRKEAAANGDVGGLFQRVVKMIMLDVNDGDVNKPTVLNRDMMIRILHTYGEEDAALEPSVVDEMLRAAGVTEPDDDGEDTNTLQLNATTLMQATTGDIQQYSLDWEVTPTTHYDDATEGTTLEQQRHSAATASIRNSLDNDEVVVDGEKDTEIPEQGVKQSISFHQDGQQKVKRVFTFPTIDYVAENYRSKSFTVVLWVLTIVAFFAYAFQLQTGIGQQSCEKFNSEFGCRVTNSIISWIFIFLQLSILGTAFITLASAGNSIYLGRNLRSFAGAIVGICTITTVCFLSYFFEIQLLIINTIKSENEQNKFAYIFVFALGCILTLYQIQGLITVCLPDYFWRCLPVRLQEFLIIPGMAKAERCTKQAASYKVNRMVDSALGHHAGDLNKYTDHGATYRMKVKSSANQGAFGQAMIHFQATSEFREPVGGVFYTFKRMWNGSLFNEEGVWLHSRIYAMNCSQWFIVMFYIVLYIVVYNWAINNIYQATFEPTTSPWPTPAPTELDRNALAGNYAFVFSTFLQYGGDVLQTVWANITETYPDLVTELAVGMLNVTNLEIMSDVASQLDPEVLSDIVTAASSNIDLNFRAIFSPENVDIFDGGDRRYLEDMMMEEEAQDPLPTQTQATIAVTAGAIAAVLATTALAIIWIPSSVSTIMQFRSGVIGSLHDKGFKSLRVAPDLTTALFGSAFWGALYMSGILFALIGLLTLLLVWHVSRSVVLILISQVVGIAVTIAAKILILLFVRKSLFVGLFKKKPLGGNIMLLIFECWSLGLTVGTMAVRMVKLVLVAAFYVGRIDTPLFAPGVGQVGPIHIDGHPLQYRKDLVLHDAHRHPYMERLGVIYMLKLKYGDDFGTRSGGAWRLIFVLALMPWLRRYRLDDDLNHDESNMEEYENEDGKPMGNQQIAREASMKDGMSAAKAHEHADLVRLRKYVSELEKKMEEKLGEESASRILDQVTQEFAA